MKRPPFATLHPYRDQPITRVRPRGPFVTGARGVRVHLVSEARAVWRVFGVRYAASTVCGKLLRAATFHLDAPDTAEMCDFCVLADGASPVVYRALDRDTDLLYVGASTRLLNRVLSHAAATSWWPLVCRITYVEYPDQASALFGEAAAIVTESPRFNSDWERSRARALIRSH